MRAVTWNVNGLRACVGKGFVESFTTLDADVFCLQETKLQEGQIVLDLPGYHQYWNYAEKKGYSGTAVFTKTEPLSVSYGIGVEVHDHEGRVITLEFEDDEWIVTDLDEVGDDEDYEAGIERVAGGDKDLIAKFYEAHDMSGDPLKSIREKYIREYVEENKLDVTAYQDEGWDPVELK